MIKATNSALGDRFKITLLFRPIDAPSFNLGQALRRKPVPNGPKEFIFSGMTCRPLGNVWRLHHVFWYRNRREWETALSGFDFFLSVAGSAHSALPLAYAGKNFSIWVATDYLSDRMDRRKQLRPWRRGLDALFQTLALWQEKKVLAAADRILAISNFTRDKLETVCPGQRIEVLHYPVDSLLLAQEKRPTRYEFDVVFTGRLADPRKNTDLVFRALAILQANNIKIRAALIGDSSAEQITRVHELGLRDLSFLGTKSHSEILLILNKSNLFLIPSNQEGLCIAGLEALACGLPIISTRCGGPEDFVIDGWNGLLVGKNNEVELAEAIEKLLSSPVLAERLGSNSRHLANQMRENGYFSEVMHGAISGNGAAKCVE